MNCIEEGCVRPVKCRGLCNSHYARLWRIENSEKHKAIRARATAKKGQSWYTMKTKNWRYGLEEGQYDQMFDLQNGRCAICGNESERSLAIDHDHYCCTGTRSCGDCVRGLLCVPCNSILGLAHDNPDILQAALDYLRLHSLVLGKVR